MRDLRRCATMRTPLATPARSGPPAGAPDATPPAPAPAAADTTAPAAPTGLTAGPPTATSVPLSWTAATDNVAVTGYQVYRDGASAPVQTITGTTYTDTALSPNTTYSYTVKAIDGAGNQSPASNIAAATTTATGGTSITLTPSDDATIDPATAANTISRIKVDASAPVNELLVKFDIPASCTP